MQFVRLEHAVVGQLFEVVDAIDVLGDPEQGVQVAQAALAVLDVRLDEIARLAAAAVALLALGELGRDEIRPGALHHLLVEARHQLVEQLLVAEQEARFEQRGADRHVRLGLPDALVDRAGGVADLQAQVPQAVENGLGDRLAPGGLLVGQQEQQIDVGTRRHQPAAVAAGRDDRHALRLGGVFRWVEMLEHEFEQDADDVILHSAKPLGAAAALAVLQEMPLGIGAAGGQHAFHPLRDRAAKFLLGTRMIVRKLGQFGHELALVEGWIGASRGLVEREHWSFRIAKRGPPVTAPHGKITALQGLPVLEAISLSRPE